jgi:Gram-negative bacterial TonB protein C-terminal
VAASSIPWEDTDDYILPTSTCPCIGNAVAMYGQCVGQQPVSVSRIVGLEYPWFARLAVLQGSVELQATISRKGTVKHVRVVSGPKPLSDAAAKSLSRWVFKGCRADECTASVVFSFILNGTCNAGTNCPSSFQADLPDKVTVTATSINAIVN